VKPLIIPLFIPHSGCPHRCVFCDQEQITAQPGGRTGPAHVRAVLEQALQAPTYDSRRHPEAAFYGGTFTGLPVDRMQQLLEAVRPYVADGRIHSIRVSTRPDAIDEERLGILKAFHVTTVELGVQSMDDRVLTLARRGHAAQDVRAAVGLLKRGGFKAGIQLRPGLPGDSEETFRATVEEVIGLSPDMVRLYPALAIAGTGLARMAASGIYRPLTLDAAVAWCVDATVRLETNGIPVIRIGLMSSPSLLQPGRIAAGPWHPAFGFLVRSAIHHRGIEGDLPAPGTVRQMTLLAPGREIPLVRGHRNQGIRRIEEKTGATVIGIGADETVPRGKVRIRAK